MTDDAPLISLQELQLAARNHGMPLEALRWDVTPVGLHYLLIHYDIPEVDASAWRLEVAGSSASAPFALLDDLRSEARDRVAVTMECAGNGRAGTSTARRSASPGCSKRSARPYGAGAVAAVLLDEAGVGTARSRCCFTGLDRGVEGGEAQVYERACRWRTRCARRSCSRSR